MDDCEGKANSRASPRSAERNLKALRNYHMVWLLKFSVVIEKDEDGYYVGTVSELPGCHTQAKTLDELMERVKEAVELYSEVEGPMTRQKGR